MTGGADAVDPAACRRDFSLNYNKRFCSRYRFVMFVAKT